MPKFVIIRQSVRRARRFRVHLRDFFGRGQGRVNLEGISNLRVAIAALHLSITMLDAYKGLGSTGRSLQIALDAKNCMSMKVPVEIDLSRASFTLCQFNKKVSPTEEGDFGFSVGISNGPITPFQIIARASAARGNFDWDKAAIFSRSCFLVGLSLPPSDSSFIFITSRETCTTNISGKLCHKNKHLQVA